MAGTCVFCGQKPTAKTKEHILPQWLLRLTGNPKRLANFGPRLDEPGKVWQFSFDSFHFPACKKCNDHSAKLEDRVAPLFASLLNGGALSGHQISTLLDWLDKVRVGLWLAHGKLGGSGAGVHPHFHIRDRVRSHDRALIIFRCSPNLPALNFGGTIGPSFQYSPTAFTLRVRHVVLVNASFADLCAGRLGFPYFDNGEHLNLNGLIQYNIKPGTGLFQLPIAPLLPNIPSGGFAFFQPIYSEMLRAQNGQWVEGDPHLRKFSAGMPVGAGMVFRLVDEGVSPVHNSIVQNVVPRDAVDNRTAILDVLEFAMLTQEAAWSSTSADRLPEGERDYWNAHLGHMRAMNELIRKEAERELTGLNYIRPLQTMNLRPTRPLVIVPTQLRTDRPRTK